MNVHNYSLFCYVSLEFLGFFRASSVEMIESLDKLVVELPQGISGASAGIEQCCQMQGLRDICEKRVEEWPSIIS